MTAEILIVDDNAINRKVISGLVEEQDFEANTASSASEAIEILKSGQALPDIIFMDIVIFRCFVTINYD